MSEFFRGWRRKVGVVTLLTACVAMVGWVRSDIVRDQLWFSKDPSPNQVFIESCAGSVRFFFGRANGEITRGGGWWISRRCRAADRHFAGFGVPFVFDWRWQTVGFDFGNGHEVQTPPNQYILNFAFIPYWSIVILLTALSTVLLIRKPRQSTQQKTAEPIPEKVA